MTILNKIKNKENFIFIAFIFLLTAVFLQNIISTSRIMDNIHYTNDVTFISHNLKKSLFEYGELYLWTPYYYSGRPLYAQPEYYFLDFNFIYILLFRNIFIAMNLAALTYFFLAGLGMYLLFLTFKDSKPGAFIAALIYMFNGFMHSFVISGNLNVLAGYSLIPFAFMFFVKALKSKDFVMNSIFSGLLIALQLLAGSALFITYEILLFAVYALFYIFGKNLKGRILKLLIVGLIVILVGFGVSAIKLLPGAEFLDLSNRGVGISYQEYLGHTIDPNNLIHVLITTLFTKGGKSAAIGIIGFILLILSLYSFKKRYVIFPLAIIILSILMAIQGPIADLFFRIPVFNQLRQIERAIFLTAFASSLLAGAGLVIVLQKIRKFKVVIFSVIVLLILVELMFLQPFPQSNKIVLPKSIPINDYISQDSETFRTINLAMSTLIGASGYNYLSQIGIGTIKGGSGIWFNDYLSYLSIAQQTNPAKFWGLLNNKYVIAANELNIPGLQLIDKFEADRTGCNVCEAYGPYLYENLEFMPRAYFVDNSVLVIGPNQNANQIVYPFLLNNNFDPKKSVIIQGKDSVGKYTLEEIKKYDAVIFSTNLENRDIAILRAYVDNGGILLPKIFDNKNVADAKDIEDLFKKLDGSFEEITVLNYESNSAIYDVNNKKGFLVLSERFSNFPGWEAQGMDKKEILKANGIITAVFIDNDDKVIFKYRPKSFRNGLFISSIALLFIVGYFVYYFVKKKKD